MRSEQQQLYRLVSHNADVPVTPRVFVASDGTCEQMGPRFSFGKHDVRIPERPPLWVEGRTHEVHSEFVHSARVTYRDLNMPGWSVHPLKGNREGRHAMAVSGPWRITFRWDGKDAHELALEQYH